MLKFALKKYFMARQSAMLITGTGRSGTTFLANVLNSTYPEISVGHEVEPTGVGIQNLPEDEHRRMLILGRGRFAWRNAWRSNNHPALIESNCFLAPSIDAYMDVWARCKVVGVIRSWESCVESMASQTFTGSPHYKYADHDHQGSRRPNPVTLKQMPAKTWQSYSRLQKIAWYWSYVNDQLIEAAKRRPERVMLISFEHMKNEPVQTIKEIQKYFGLEVREPVLNVWKNSGKERGLRRIVLAELPEGEYESMQQIVFETVQKVDAYFSDGNKKAGSLN